MLRYSGNTEVLELDKFAVDESERAEKTRRHKARIKANKDPNNISARRGNWHVATFVAMCCLIAACVYIYGDIELNQMNSEKILINQRIDAAQRNNTRLVAELGSMATPSRIEEFALANGLVREQLPPIPISISVGKVVEVASQEELGFFAKIWSEILGVLDYLGFL